MSAMSTSQGYTVGIICPLEIELSAVRYMLDEECQPPTSYPHLAHYIFGKLSGHNVVVASLPANSQGKVFTTKAACDLKYKFPALSLYLLVGIGGGIPSPSNDIRLGDVVISTPTGTHCGVVQYDLGKEQTNGFVRKGYLGPPPRQLLEILPKLQSDHRVRQSKIVSFIEQLANRQGLQQYTRPPPYTDLLFGSHYCHPLGNAKCSDCDRSQLVQRPERADPHSPRIHYGLIASGDKVIKDGRKRGEIAREAGGAICFEMEAAGLMNDFPCVVIRGICDYADSHKNDDWHGYAAAAAAAMAKEILEYIPPSSARISQSQIWEGHRPKDTQHQPAIFSGTFNAQQGKQFNIGHMNPTGNVTLG